MSISIEQLRSRYLDEYQSLNDEDQVRESWFMYHGLSKGGCEYLSNQVELSLDRLDEFWCELENEEFLSLSPEEKQKLEPDDRERYVNWYQDYSCEAQMQIDPILFEELYGISELEKAGKLPAVTIPPFKLIGEHDDRKNK